MNVLSTLRRTVVAVMSLGLVAGSAAAFDSGSTGIDGAFTPTVDTELQLPPDGIFNFTDVDIPSGVTVTFSPSTINTPVTILASGDVTIAGTIGITGGDAARSGAAGDGNLGDDGLPGVGAPGGFDGGRGGTVDDIPGGYGLGPGAGGSPTTSGCVGGGGGFGTAGGAFSGCHGSGGTTYGSETLLPLIGGSGGGGGAGGTNFGGAGGGGGGGAILIAASGTVDITGLIDADGGGQGDTSGSGAGGRGGAGSGGGIRVVATNISGNGTVRARGGSFTSPTGGKGRIRFEAENFLRTSGTDPAFTFGAPGDVFVAGLPTLTITTVAGVPAPTQPTGDADITLPEGTPNPVTVEFQTASVPDGNTVTLTVTPANGVPVVAVSNALTGGQANVDVDLPDGPSILSATVSFTVTAAIGDMMKHFAQGERVERIVLAAAAGAGSTTTFITVSGKEYTWPSNAVAMN